MPTLQERLQRARAEIEYIRINNERDEFMRVNLYPPVNYFPPLPEYFGEHEEDYTFSGGECDYCGANETESHSLNCPGNSSPYAQLINEGYD